MTAGKPMEVTMIDAAVGTAYTLCLCAALERAGANVELIAPENRVVMAPVGYRILRWMPGKDSGSKVAKTVGYAGYLLRVWAHALLHNRAGHATHFQFFRRERIECLYFMGLRLFGIRLVFTAHNILPHENSRIDHILTSGVYRAANRIIVHSEYMKEKLARLFPVDPAKIAIVPHGSFDDYIPSHPPTKLEARTKLELSDSDHVVLFFGYVREYKGLDLLLDAFEIAQQQDERLKLVVAGAAHSPELGARYRQRIAAISRDGSIVHHDGFVATEDVAAYFTAADAVILPYKETDHSGIVHLAYSFGRPVISTDVGDMADIIEDGRSGYVLGEHTADCLARTIVGAFSATTGLEDMGRYARQLSDEKYSWDAIARQTLDVYRSLDRPGRQPAEQATGGQKAAAR